MINDIEHGTLFTVDGVEYVGVICFGSGIWAAYDISDPKRTLRIIAEDENA